MNSDWITVSDRYATPPTLTDLLVTVWPVHEAAPVAVEYLDESTGLILEAAPVAVRSALEVADEDFFFRLRGLPDRVTEHKCVVELIDDPAPNLVLDVFSFGGQPVQVRTLYDLFEPAAGSVPVILEAMADGTGDPIIGVEFSVWTSDLTVPVVPLVRTDSAGIARCALPPGTYKVFGFKPYCSFVSAMPVTLTVGSSLTTLSFSLSQAAATLPAVPKVTLYGWVLDGEVHPVAGAEVKMRVLNTPQRLTGGAFALRADIVKETDVNGRFEFYPAAGTQVVVTCDATGYARKGRLPLSGSLDWEQLGKEVAE